MTTVAEGGSGARRIWQGRSLFGLDHFVSSNGKELQRLHGYSVGSIELDPRKPNLRFWPREGRKFQGREFLFSTDSTFKLPRNKEHTRPALIDIRLHSPNGSARPAVASAPGPPVSIQIVSSDSSAAIWPPADTSAGVTGVAARREPSEKTRFYIVVDAPLNECEQQVVEGIVQELRRKLSDGSLKLITTRKGSIVLMLEGSEDAFENLDAAFRNGDIEQIQGAKIVRAGPLRSLEPELIKWAKEGDVEAFGGLHYLYAKPIRGYVLARTLNDQDADDVIQETWITLLGKVHTYDASRASFLAFAKYWAGIMTLRHHRGKRDAYAAVLFSDLTESYPNFEGELEIADFADKSTWVPFASNIESDLDNALEFDRLIKTIFGGSSPPHQLLTFVLVKLLDWKPSDVVVRYSDTSLRDLAEIVEYLYSQEFNNRRELVVECFAHLQSRMPLLVEQIFSEPAAREPYGHLLGKKIGDTRLKDYFTDASHPEKNISHWWYAVQRRVVVQMVGAAATP